MPTLLLRGSIRLLLVEEKQRANRALRRYKTYTLSGFGTNPKIANRPHRQAACARSRTFARRKCLGERQFHQGGGMAFMPVAKVKVELAPFGHTIRETRLLGLVTALLAGAAWACRSHLSDLALHYDRKLVD